MGEVEEKIGADYLRLLAAKQRLSVMNSEVKKMTGNLNMAISLLNGEETGHYAYRVHNRPHSSVSHRPLTLPTVEELSKIVEYRKQAKDGSMPWTNSSRSSRWGSSVVSHKYGYEGARAFWSSARRDDL